MFYVGEFHSARFYTNRFKNQWNFVMEKKFAEIFSLKNVQILRSEQERQGL